MCVSLTGKGNGNIRNGVFYSRLANEQNAKDQKSRPPTCVKTFTRVKRSAAPVAKNRQTWICLFPCPPMKPTLPPILESRACALSLKCIIQSETARRKVQKRIDQRWTRDANVAHIDSNEHPLDGPTRLTLPGRLGVLGRDLHCVPSGVDSAFHWSDAESIRHSEARYAPDAIISRNWSNGI
jgi:hypothetical protein